MRKVTMLSLIVLLPLLAARADDTDPEPPDTGRNALIGEWEIVSIKQQGQELKFPVNVLTFTVTFDRNGSMAVSTGGETKKGKWKVAAATNLRHLDITSDNQVSLAVYKLEKGELTIASNEPGGARPKNVESGQAVMKLKKKPK